MKKLVILLGFIFCTAFVANAQLKYQNGKLLLNVPDYYLNYTLPNEIVTLSQWNSVVLNTPLFITQTASADNVIFRIQHYYMNYWMEGPMVEGTISMCTPINNEFNIYYHNLHLKNAYNYSDARAKTNIRPLSSATSTIMRLNPVTYQFINRSNDQSTRRVAGADGTETGFLAQEVARVLPNAVAIDGKDQYLLNYTSIIPVLVKAVQEQQAQIEALQAEIATLKNR